MTSTSGGDGIWGDYRIFSGAKVKWATLRFSAERARWVALEQWHPDQKSHFEKDGRYVLRFPYSDDRELIMDILRHVPKVEVIAGGGPHPAGCRIESGRPVNLAPWWSSRSHRLGSIRSQSVNQFSI